VSSTVLLIRPPSNHDSDYGVLTVLNGKLPTATTSALLETLKAQSKTTGLSSAELLLSWANDRLDGVVVSSTSRSDRAVETVALFLSDHPTRLADGVYDQIEQAAARDGFEGKVFYKHRHMEAVVAA